MSKNDNFEKLAGDTTFPPPTPSPSPIIPFHAPPKIMRQRRWTERTTHERLNLNKLYFHAFMHVILCITVSEGRYGSVELPA